MPETLQIDRTTQQIPAGLKILIVEDDHTSELLLTISLEDIKAKTFSTNSGHEAVEICKNRPDIDLILMDIRLPEMDGFTATKEIRYFNKKVVIIAQTAYGLTGDKEKAIKMGCDDYIAKPIDIRKLHLLVLKHLGKNNCTSTHASLNS